MPTYNIDDFYTACNTRPNDVVPIGDTLHDADLLFKLKTKSQLLAFIGNGGLENLDFQNFKEWENNPDSNHPILVDAYEFRSMYILGYIAFFYNDRTRKWIIKSFHLSQNHNDTMRLAFERAGLPGGKK